MIKTEHVMRRLPALSILFALNFLFAIRNRLQMITRGAILKAVPVCFFSVFAPQLAFGSGIRESLYLYRDDVGSAYVCCMVPYTLLKVEGHDGFVMTGNGNIYHTTDFDHWDKVQFDQPLSPINWYLLNGPVIARWKDKFVGFTQGAYIYTSETGSYFSSLAPGPNLLFAEQPIAARVFNGRLLLVTNLRVLSTIDLSAWSTDLDVSSIGSSTPYFDDDERSGAMYFQDAKAGTYISTDGRTWLAKSPVDALYTNMAWYRGIWTIPVISVDANNNPFILPTEDFTVDLLAIEPDGSAVRRTSYMEGFCNRPPPHDPPNIFDNNNFIDGIASGTDGTTLVAEVNCVEEIDSTFSAAVVRLAYSTDGAYWSPGPALPDAYQKYAPVQGFSRFYFTGSTLILGTFGYDQNAWTFLLIDPNEKYDPELPKFVYEVSTLKGEVGGTQGLMSIKLTAENMTLAQAATAMGVDHFNFDSKIMAEYRLNGGDVGDGYVLMTNSDCLQPYANFVCASVAGKNGYLYFDDVPVDDPIPGGYAYEKGDQDACGLCPTDFPFQDSYPWYWDEVFGSDGVQGSQPPESKDPLYQPSTSSLLFLDAPTAPEWSATSFQTSAVAVRGDFSGFKLPIAGRIISGTEIDISDDVAWSYRGSTNDVGVVRHLISGQVSGEYGNLIVEIPDSERIATSNFEIPFPALPVPLGPTGLTIGLKDLFKP